MTLKTIPVHMILPTHVGMARKHDMSTSIFGNSPHARGDGPNQRQRNGCLPGFSPRTWGWPGLTRRIEISAAILPTHVGMARDISAKLPASRHSPHARGDGPRDGLGYTPQDVFSPRTWGWPPASMPSPALMPILPTHVGMAREGATNGKEGWNSPHARGDGP